MLIFAALVPPDASSVPATVMPAPIETLTVVPAAIVTVTPGSIVVAPVTLTVPVQVAFCVMWPQIPSPGGGGGGGLSSPGGGSFPEPTTHAANGKDRASARAFIM